jgi:polyhydroxyalkanoate synthesis repressor PhaR
VTTNVIKKYGNRRLYDTLFSRYITLEELAAKIRAGSDVRVVDAQTDEDLTQATLTQIVLETGNASKFLPVQLLVQMIRLSDDALAEFFSRYVTGALEMYIQAKRTLATYNPLSQLPMAATDALARIWGTPFGSAYQQAPYSQGYAQPSPHVAPPPAPHDEADRRTADTEPEARADDVAAMRRELDELKQAVRDNLGSRRRKRKP